MITLVVDIPSRQIRGKEVRVSDPRTSLATALSFAAPESVETLIYDGETFHGIEAQAKMALPAERFSDGPITLLCGVDGGR